MASTPPPTPLTPAPGTTPAPASMAGQLPGSAPGSSGPGPGSSLADQYSDGVSELTAFASVSGSAAVPCAGRPVVVSKSSLVAANGACPEDWKNISCSCIENADTNTTSEWVLNIKQKDAKATTTTVPTTLNPTSDSLEVNAIGAFTLPSHVTTLRMLSVTSDAAARFNLDFVSPYRRGAAMIETKTENFIKEVELAGIDLSNLELTEDFLPPSVTTLTLRSCKLQKPPSSYFMLRWDKLVSLDFSNNNLSTWYGIDTTSSAPVSNGCSVTTLNLSGNNFNAIPTAILGMNALQSLNLSSNPIKNLTISEALFNMITGLQSFSLDGVDTSPLVSSAACGNSSTVKTAHNVSFCVALSASAGSNSTATTPTGTESPASGPSVTLVVAAVCGGLLIVILVAALVYVHRKRRNEQGKTLNRLLGEQGHTYQPRGFDSIPETASHHTLSLGQTSDSCNPLLLSDPMIITSRIDHNELVFGELRTQGGFGMVFSGVYRRRRVAIKKLRGEFSMDPKLIDAFLKEIALMASLSHPHIVEYIGCAWDHLRNLSMVTELMTRGDLREVLLFYKHRKAPLTWAATKARMALHIAEGLHYLHTLNPKVIHRDLKAKNALVSDELDVKLTDFGVSREGCFEQTHMTAGIGTSFWIAPEVLAGVRYDERADIFSFGVVLSEIDTDDYPYWNSSDQDEAALLERGPTQEAVILKRVLNGEMRPQFTPTCPPSIQYLADRCLDGEPSKRPSASEIVEYLKAVMQAPASESLLKSDV